MPDFAVTVVGAGVVGLAVAARLAEREGDVLVLERRERCGTETSSRNSEVIHAGFYYPTGSLKARLCVRGNRLLYELCGRHGVAHRRITKIVTAVSDDEVPVLERLREQGRLNDVPLEWKSGEEARALEPNVRSAAALYSPSTGIVSAHELMDLFAQKATAAGATLQTRARVVGIERRTADYAVTVAQGDAKETETVTTERLVNAAGLGSDEVAALAGIDVDAAGYRLHYCKGRYFALTPAKWGLVSRLIYPVPGRESLGVHAVVDVTGRVRFGPDVDYLPSRDIDYAVAGDSSLRAAFGAAARRFLPDVRDEDLTPDISGVRAKLQPKGAPVRDFVIQEESARGLPGLVNLVGIDSPGLTSSPAIAELVAELLA